MSRIKSDFYKLFHSKLFLGLPALFGAAFFLLTLTHSGVYVMHSIWNGNSLGFAAFVKTDGAAYSGNDFIQTACFSAWCIWIFALLFSVMFFSREFSDGTIKLAYTYGISCSRIYVSKLFTMISYFGLIYLVFQIISYFYIRNCMNVILQPQEFLYLCKCLLSIFGVMVGFMITCIFLLLIIRNSTLTVLILSVGTFVMGYLMMATWNPDNPTPKYLFISPIYYLMRITNSEICIQAVWYVLINALLLIPLSILVMSKGKERLLR